MFHAPANGGQHTSSVCRLAANALKTDCDGGKPRAAEFFAGIGLVRLALERENWQVVFANDIDRRKAEMYRHRWPETSELVVDDIRKLDSADLPDCELFTGCFPCNNLSVAGKWEGIDGKHSSAFWELIRLLRQLGRHRPPLLVLENVVGFLLRNRGGDLRRALLALSEFGYCIDAMILNAANWVPQSRKRLFLIAAMEPPAERVTWLMATQARPPALIDFISRNQDISWHLAELPPLPRSTKRVADIVEDVHEDSDQWWPKDRREYFLGQLSHRHAAEAQRLIAAKAVCYATAFRRMRNGRSMAELRTDGLAGCLRTPRGGSARQILLKAGLGRYQVRLMTPRECARLQGVPDSYPINVPANQALAGFGDAVCVPTFRWLLRQLPTLHRYVKTSG
jgi:DNA (cytosine-5)-methyltransferase 1